MKNNPIGIVDSGLGGLTVWKEIVTLLPHESTVYLADSANAPYGKKSAEEIYELAKKLVAFLLTKKVKLVVIACNTITVSCLEKLREDYPMLSIVGTVPAVKTAVEITKNKKIGILTTTRTAASDYLKQLINTFASSCEIEIQGTDALVPLIEQGKQESREMQDTLRPLLKRFQDKQIDTLILGSTHFPFLGDQIQEFFGPKVILLDSGAAIAKQVKSVLTEESQLREGGASYQFYTTGDPQIAKKLLHSTIAEEKEFTKITMSS